MFRNINLLTFCLKSISGFITAVIPKNSRVPTSMSKVFTTYKDNQNQVKIQNFEEFAPIAKNNHLLDSFDLMLIKQAPRGIPQVKVVFEIDSNGILLFLDESKATKLVNQ